MISIIVPVYNVEAYLPQCLDSLIHQTYQDLEIICVNDGSKDRSLEILKEYANKDRRIKPISRDNKGISISRNEALERATGEYVMFVDSDDWIEENTCQKALEAMVKYNVDLVIWSYLREYESRSMPIFLYQAQQNWDDDISLLTRRFIGPVKDELACPQKLDSYGTVWGKIYKRSIIEQNKPIRFIDTKLISTCEDILFNIEYSLRIRCAIYIPELLYHYRKTDTSYTSKYRPDLPTKWQKQYEIIMSIIQRESPILKEAYYNRIALGLVGQGLNITFSRFPLKTQLVMLADILKAKWYSDSVQQLSLDYMPYHWKLFYTFAKQKKAIGVLILLKIIKIIIRK